MRRFAGSGEPEHQGRLLAAGSRRATTRQRRVARAAARFVACRSHAETSYQTDRVEGGRLDPGELNHPSTAGDRGRLSDRVALPALSGLPRRLARFRTLQVLGVKPIRLGPPMLARLRASPFLESRPADPLTRIVHFGSIAV